MKTSRYSFLPFILLPFILVLVVTILYYMISGIITESNTKKVPRYSFVEEYKCLSSMLADTTYVVKGEGTMVGFLRRVNVEREYDKFMCAVFVPDTFKVVVGQKIRLIFYKCYATDSQGQPNYIFQIKEVAN